MIGLKISRNRLNIATIIILSYVFGSTDQNENVSGSVLNVSDDETSSSKSGHVQETSIISLRKKFSNSANLSNFLNEYNIFKLDAQIIENYVKLIFKDIEFFEETLIIESQSIKKDLNFEFLHRFCSNVIPVIFKNKAKQFKSLSNLEDIFDFIDNIPNKFWETERSEDEIRGFESLCVESKEIVAESKNNLRKRMDKYDFSRNAVLYKKIELTILNCYLICFYSKVAFSYGFCGFPTSNEFYSNLSVANELRNALLRDRVLSEIQNTKHVILPRLEGENFCRNTVTSEEVNDLLKGKYKNDEINEEPVDFENKSIQDLLDWQKTLELELIVCEDNFCKIENKKNKIFEKFNDFEKKNMESFNSLVLEFYKPRADLFWFFMCPDQSEKLELDLLEKIRVLTNTLLNFYYKLEREYIIFYKKLKAFVIKSNSLKLKLKAIQNAIDMIYQNTNSI